MMRSESIRKVWTVLNNREPLGWIIWIASTRLPCLSAYSSVHAERTDKYDDTISKWLQLDEQRRVQGNLSSPHIGNRSISAPVSSMSIDTMWNVDRRYGKKNSSANPLRPEDRLKWFKQFFDIGVEETLTKPQQGSRGRGWRAGHDAHRTFALVENSQSCCGMKVGEKSAGADYCKKETQRIRELKNRSQLYKEVRKRNGIWVSEIRVGQTNEKVWLWIV